MMIYRPSPVLRRTPILLAALLALACALPAGAQPNTQAKVNYQDQILPIFRNACLNCHNPDKMKAGLDLSTYAATLEGADAEKVLSPGNPDDSPLYKTVAHLEAPNMPKGGAKLPDGQIALIKQWIASGALETATGKPIAAEKPKVNLSVVVPVGKPAGPVAMPKGLATQLIVTPHRPGPVQCMAASPWAPVLAVGAPHQVLLYNTDTLALLGVVPYPDGDVTSVRFSRSGNVLLAAGGVGAKLGRILLIDVATGKKITELGQEFDEVLTADILPDQSAIAIGTTSRLVKIYATADGRLLNSIKKHTDWVTAVAFSPDGRYLASGDRAGNLYVWDAHRAFNVYTLTGHKAGITALAFRDDGHLLASASEDGTVKLWNMIEGVQLKSISASSPGVTDIDFAHDGRFATAGRDHTARLFAPDGRPLKSFPRFADIALRVAFSHDGARLFAADFTGQIRAFSTDKGKQLAAFTILQPPAH